MCILIHLFILSQTYKRLITFFKSLGAKEVIDTNFAYFNFFYLIIYIYILFLFHPFIPFC